MPKTKIQLKKANFRCFKFCGCFIWFVRFLLGLEKSIARRWIALCCKIISNKNWSICGSAECFLMDKLLLLIELVVLAFDWFLWTRNNWLMLLCTLPLCSPLTNFSRKQWEILLFFSCSYASQRSEKNYFLIFLCKKMKKKFFRFFKN